MTSKIKFILLKERTLFFIYKIKFIYYNKLLQKAKGGQNG